MEEFVFKTYKLPQVLQQLSLLLQLPKEKSEGHKIVTSLQREVG